MPVTMSPDKQFRSGSEPFTVLQLQRTVTFATPLPSANYDLAFVATGLAISVTVTSKTAAGFTINLAIGIAGTISWIARET